MFSGMFLTKDLKEGKTNALAPNLFTAQDRDSQTPGWLLYSSTFKHMCILILSLSLPLLPKKKESLLLFLNAGTTLI